MSQDVGWLVRCKVLFLGQVFGRYHLGGCMVRLSCCRLWPCGSPSKYLAYARVSVLETGWVARHDPLSLTLDFKGGAFPWRLLTRSDSFSSVLGV